MILEIVGIHDLVDVSAITHTPTLIDVLCKRVCVCVCAIALAATLEEVSHDVVRILVFKCARQDQRCER